MNVFQLFNFAHIIPILMEKSLTQGSITRNLLTISSPITLGIFFRAFRDLVDLMWIGRISSAAVAAVAIFITIHWMVMILNEVIGISSLSLVSQFFGAKDLAQTQLIVEQTIAFKAFLGIIASIILLVFLEPLIAFFTNDPVVLALALEYGYIRLLCLPLLFTLASINTVLRSIGNAGISMFILFLASLINLLLDPVFIFDQIPGMNIGGLNLGVFGAALASVISTIVAFFVAFFVLFSGKAHIKISIKRLFKLNWEIDKKLMRIGLPSGVSTLFIHFFNLLALKLISMYGTAAIAAMGIGRVINGFVTIPLMGMALAGTAIVGQSLGAKQLDRVNKTVYIACFYSVFLMAAISVFFIIFPQMIMAGFTKDQDVIDIGVTMLKITIPGFIFVGVTSSLKPAFYGAGFNLPFLLSSIISLWLIQLPFLICVIYVFQLEINYIWISFVLAQFAEMLVFAILFKKGDWKTKKI